MMRALVVLAILFSFDVLAYPIILKIQNTRKNPLFLYSQMSGAEIKIEPGETLEVLVLGEGDWRARYASGLLGCTKWNFDEPLHSAIEGCKSWAVKGGFLVCDLEFTIFESGLTTNSYGLKTIDVKGESEAIKVEAASIVLLLYFDQNSGLVTEHDRPRLRNNVAEPAKHYVNEFFTAITRVPTKVFETRPETAWLVRGLLLSYTQEQVRELKENDKPLVEHSKILQAIFDAEETTETQTEEPVTPGQPVSPGILAYLASLVLGK